jgi:lipopolysaccharide/colanic/teichoic acid biosynthesis glycosyltransferase
MSASKNGTGAAPGMSSPGASPAGSWSSGCPVCCPSGSSGSYAVRQLIDQAAFLQLLCLERKRSDRSGRRFVLMLLHTGELLSNTHNIHAFQDFVRELCVLTRDTDVKGWYKYDAVFGVIFTEIGDVDGRTITAVLLNKVTKALGRSFSIEAVKSVHLSFHVYPEIHSDSPERTANIDLTLYPDQRSASEAKLWSRIIKRVVDVVGSIYALVLFSPVFLVIAIAIRVTSRGPILFRQRRVGRYGSSFTFLKFRSMYVASDDQVHQAYVKDFISGKQTGNSAAEDNAVFKMTADPRVTSVGRWLRRSSLDELPQLVNVLKGEMSLVGPRPPVPYEVASYQSWHRLRLIAVKPGITGLWQVRGRSRVKFNDMVRLDLMYARTWSIWLDIEILLKTPGAVLSGHGAY